MGASSSAAACLCRPRLPYLTIKDRLKQKDEDDNRNLQRIFMSFDRDGSNTVDAKEIRGFFHSNPDFQKGIWKTVDVNDDSKLGQKEFRGFIKALLQVTFESYLPAEDETIHTLEIEQMVHIIVTHLLGKKQYPSNKKSFIKEFKTALGVDIKKFNNGNDDISFGIFQSYLLQLLANNLHRPNQQEEEKLAMLNLKSLVLLATDRDPRVKHNEKLLKKLRGLRKKGKFSNGASYFEYISKNFNEPSQIEKVVRLMSAVQPKDWCSFSKTMFDNVMDRMEEIKHPNNVLVCPALAYVATMMLQLLTKDRTARELANLLSKVDLKELEKIPDVTDLNHDVEFNFASAVWVSVDVPSSSLEEMNKIANTMNYYMDAQILGVDWEKQADVLSKKTNGALTNRQERNRKERREMLALSAKNVNNWCNKKTNGKVGTILDQELPKTKEPTVLPMMVARLRAKIQVNVVERRNGHFKVKPGTIIRCPFFKLAAQTVNFIKTKKIIMVDLPLTNHHLRAAFAISRTKPFEAPSWSDVFKDKDMPELAAKLRRRTQNVQVIMPEVRVEWSGSIANVMQHLGSTRVFTQQAQWVSGFGNDTKMKNVLQKAVIELQFSQRKITDAKEPEKRRHSVIIDSNNKVSLTNKKSAQEFLINRPHLLIIYNQEEKGSEKILFIGAIKQLPQYGAAMHNPTFPARFLAFGDEEEDPDSAEEDYEFDAEDEEATAYDPRDWDDALDNDFMSIEDEDDDEDAT